MNNNVETVSTIVIFLFCRIEYQQILSSPTTFYLRFFLLVGSLNVQWNVELFFFFFKMALYIFQTVEYIYMEYVYFYTF